MSTNPAYPPGSDGSQPPYPAQQPMSQYPPSTAPGYGSAGGFNSAFNPGYPPPVETVPSNPAFPPPPSYEASVGTGKPANPDTYGNYSYQTQPIPPMPPTSYPTAYASPDVEYGRSDESEFSGIISFSDKSIRLGIVVFRYLISLNELCMHMYVSLNLKDFSAFKFLIILVQFLWAFL